MFSYSGSPGRVLRAWTLAAVAVCPVGASRLPAQSIVPELRGIPTGTGWRLINRSVQVTDSGGRVVVTFDERPGSGVAWLQDVQLQNGIIEVELRGKDVFQQSFVGVAFRGENDERFDVVYFRPFNFRAADSARRAHAVQYSSHPGYGWPRLRTEFPGKYEQPLLAAPDPNGWFRARIEVHKPVVRVYVNGAADPALTVNELTPRTGGRIGLWVGEGSGGSFANLRITATPR